jgi:DNA-binding winged helix-turn-helix (wHTH) protein/TolB-like protein/Tfp pilus assembly protein PilF
MSSQRKRYEFGPFRLNTQQRLLLRDSEVVPLPPKAADLLVVLLENSGNVVGKDELMKQVWPDSFVEEANLSHHIFTLRKALSDDGDARYIETIPRRGYRFVAGVTEVQYETDELVLAEHSQSRIVIEHTEAPNSATDYGGSDQTDRVLALAAGTRPRKVLLASAGVMAVALAVALAVAIYFWRAGNTGGEQTADGVKSIAVLPFKPLVADSRNESLEIGMADTLITKLSGINQLIVRPISAVRKYTALDQDSIAAGRELGVDYVLEGNLQMVGEKTRATMRLLSVKDGLAIWTDKCDQQCTTIFELQDAVAQQIAGALALRITGDQKKQLAKHYTENTEAYQLYAQGRYFWGKRSGESITRSISFFQQAIEKDPAYALAYAGLANSYMLLNLFAAVPSSECIPKAEAAAKKGLEIDGRLAEAYTVLAGVNQHYYLNWSEAERLFRRAIDLDPGDSTARHNFATHLAARGMFDQAFAEIGRAREIDPVSLILSHEVGLFHYCSRRYESAIEQFRKTLELQPDFGITHELLAQTYELKGDYREALAEAQEVVRLDSHRTDMLAQVYARSGQKAEAYKVLEQLRKKEKSRYVSPSNVALVYANLGDNGQAFAYLERAYAERDWLMTFLKVEPLLDGLRSDPRFADLLRRVGLPQ